MIEKMHRLNKSLIFLVGFMGSGKSTVGPILANTLGFNFIDIDKVIEEKTQKSIPDIFKSEGEATFRNLEHNTLNELSTLTNHVIALGGGTITSGDNLKIAKEHGILVYLQISPQEALLRVQRHQADRPMLKDDAGNPLSIDQLEQRISSLLQRREQFYSKADIIVNTDNLRLGVTIDEIVKKIRTYL